MLAFFHEGWTSLTLSLDPLLFLWKWRKKKRLTITTHSDGDALLKPAILASVTVDAKNGALLILGARSILNLLLNTSPEETLLLYQTKQSDEETMLWYTSWMNFRMYSKITAGSRTSFLVTYTFVVRNSLGGGGVGRNNLPSRSFTVDAISILEAHWRARATSVAVPYLTVAEPRERARARLKTHAVVDLPSKSRVFRRYFICLFFASLVYDELFHNNVYPTFSLGLEYQLQLWPNSPSKWSNFFFFKGFHPIEMRVSRWR